MARDAAARLYDVEKNLVKLDIPRGLITVQAKRGRSLELDRLRESLQATRLSGRTGMEVIHLEITVRGRLRAINGDVFLEVPGTSERFRLDEALPSKGGAAPARAVLPRLREAAAAKEPVVAVTGRVAGWTGLFPDVLRTLGKERRAHPESSRDGPPAWRVHVTDFRPVPRSEAPKAARTRNGAAKERGL